MKDYRKFLKNKTQLGGEYGFAPTFLPDCLFDFQKYLVEWAIRKGRGAIFADCGLGKSLMELIFAENVVRNTNRSVLILTPLSVASQTVEEGEKFGIECRRVSTRAEVVRAGVYVTNYERLHHLDPSDFVGVVCDESSILKNFDGKRKAQITEFMREMPYRLLCTATAAPNDYDELGTSSEALGELGFQDMVSKFFHKQTQKDRLGWGRTSHVLRSYAERDFWRWVCSWARACRKPSDLGFSDERFQLPPLNVREHEVKASVKKSGHLFETVAVTVQEEQEEARRTLPERCDKVAELVSGTDEPAVCWCHLNDEGDRLMRSITGAKQVSGSDSDESKEEKYAAFKSGQIRVLVLKPKIGAFGLNWQHCAHQTYFPSHSFEQWYQSVRRCWRFGQTRPVTVDIVTTEGSSGVKANLERKAEKAEKMFARLVELMGDSLKVGLSKYGKKNTEVPAWL